ncbi:MAG TPA: hypothetical protein VFX15_07095 [Actinomycetes bacterium]|nr:hypothetical protein [Actinomycetes bacterium]
MVTALIGCTETKQPDAAATPSSTLRGQSQDGWPLVDSPRLDPNETRIEVGQSYAYTIYTHCGVNWIGMDGDQWQALNPLGNGNPPRGWRLPERGTITVVNKNQVVYADELGHVVPFKRVPDADIHWCA